MTALDLISRFGRSVTIRNFAANTNANGRITKGAQTDVNAIMYVCAASGSQLLHVPELQRDKKWVVGYSVAELSDGKKSNQTQPSQVIDGGFTYEVQNVKYWESTAHSIAPFFEVMMCEINQ